MVDGGWKILAHDLWWFLFPTGTTTNTSFAKAPPSQPTVPLNNAATPLHSHTHTTRSKQSTWNPAINAPSQLNQAPATIYVLPTFIIQTINFLNPKQPNPQRKHNISPPLKINWPQKATHPPLVTFKPRPKSWTFIDHTTLLIQLNACSQTHPLHTQSNPHLGRFKILT